MAPQTRRTIPASTESLWVKICGVTTARNAAAVARCDVDAIGVNFFQKSKRFVDRDAGGEIVAAVHSASPTTACVGLFVNESASAIVEVVEHCKLDAVQLHGDEVSEFPDELREAGLDLSVPILRAIRVRTRSDVAVAADTLPSPDALLLDAAVAGAFGGTGQVLDWHEFAAVGRLCHRVPVVLAGGLTPQNVAEAVRVVAPRGVDVAGGVEAAPGQKDVASVLAFVAAARQAERASRRRDPDGVE